MTETNPIRIYLKNSADETYKAFQAKLMPTVPSEKILGVRTPLIRDYAKKLDDDRIINDFFNDLPHEYYEEDNLHAFLIERVKDFDRCLSLTKAFLPYIDNWATCDCFFPPVFKKHKQEMRNFSIECMASDKIYTVRYGIGIAMKMFLGEDFDCTLAEIISAIDTTDYYIHMMVAWYFATALAKNYDEVLYYITDKKLDKKTHNKAIQKAIESYRVTQKQKDYLRTLKIK